MNKLKCPHFDSCNAPFCPLDEELKRGIWYPDEEICRRRGLNYPWLKTQKKITERAKHSDGYFTIQMLTHLRRVCRGVEGLDPDKDEAPQLQKWLKNHPAKRGLRGVSKPCPKGGFMAQNHALRGGYGGMI